MPCDTAGWSRGCFGLKSREEKGGRVPPPIDRVLPALCWECGHQLTTRHEGGTHLTTSIFLVIVTRRRALCAS